MHKEFAAKVLAYADSMLTSGRCGRDSVSIWVPSLFVQVKVLAAVVGMDEMETITAFYLDEEVPVHWNNPGVRKVSWQASYVQAGYSVFLELYQRPFFEYRGRPFDGVELVVCVQPTTINGWKTAVAGKLNSLQTTRLW